MLLKLSSGLSIDSVRDKMFSSNKRSIYACDSEQEAKICCIPSPSALPVSNLCRYCTQPLGNPGTKLKAHTTRAPASRHLMREGRRSSLGNYMG